MRHDPFQAWADADRILAGYLEQDPGASSIDLTNDLIAETGLHWLEAMRIVDDYVFRKALDTSEADWRAVRPLLLQWRQAFSALIAVVGVWHLVVLFLPPFMIAVIRALMSPAGLVAFLIMIVWERSTTCRGEVLDRRPGEKSVESL